MRALIDPLWALISAIAFTALVTTNSVRISKLLKRFCISSLIVLTFLSTGFATSIFDALLNTEHETKSDWSPKYIFVLGGGFEVGATPPEDFLGTESTRRINAASVLWRKYPSAKVVFSGQEPGTQDDRLPTRHGELAAEHAISLGLTQSRIIIESISSNTREHPVQAKALPGITSDTPIAIVTSNFHMRRALREFHRYFSNVYSFGTEENSFGISLFSFVPFTSSLDDNTYRIKEFVGIISYQLTS